MKASDLIRWAMQLTDGATERFIADMRDEALSQPIAGAKGTAAGNHPLWILGHLCVIEGGIPEILLGEPNPVAHWRPLFAAGTEPKTAADAAAYPSFDEVLRTYHELRAKNLKLLEQIGEAGLDRVPKKIPPGFEPMMATFGQTLLLITLHNMFHDGQACVARRAAGRAPMM